jgi:hypothetical protein
MQSKQEQHACVSSFAAAAAAAAAAREAIRPEGRSVLPKPILGPDSQLPDHVTGLGLAVGFRCNCNLFLVKISHAAKEKMFCSFTQNSKKRKVKKERDLT